MSVGVCLGAAALASRLPEPSREKPEEAGCLRWLSDGLAEAASRPLVRAAVIAAAVIGGAARTGHDHPSESAQIGS